MRNRLGPLERRLADAELTEGLDELKVAVDAALRLGGHADVRCEHAAPAAISARTAADAARARLAP